MNLIQLHFNYEIPEKKFSYMSYEFNPVENVLDIKETIGLAKSSIYELEIIIKSLYGDRLKKEEIGEIDPYKIKYGYKYSQKSKIFSLDSFINSTQLTYSIRLSEQGSPIELNINLNNQNAKNMLKLHDNILMLPELKVTDEVQKQIDNIEYLRHQKFDASKYLLLKK